MSCEKYTTVLGAVVWSCCSKINYCLCLAFGSSRHSDVIASHLSFNPLTLTKCQKITHPELGADLKVEGGDISSNPFFPA
jgi:hypothetical protein